MKKQKALILSTAIIVVLAMIAATLIESMEGSDFVARNIYHSWWFIALWTLLAITAFIYVLRMKQWRCLATFLMHLAFIVILCGALVTHVFGEQGYIMLVKGSPQNYFVLADSRTAAIPFNVTLDGFDIIYYEGTMSPQDYCSSLSIKDGDETIKGTVSMNNIFTYAGYRFYQSDYDTEKAAVCLAISHDPYGMSITYTGYVLLLTSMILYFFQPNSRYRRLLNRKSIIMVFMLCLTPATAFAQQQTHDTSFLYAIANASSSPLWAILCTTTGILSFCYMIWLIAKQRKASRVYGITVNSIVVATWLFLSLCIMSRTLLSHHLPLSNGSETMLVLSWLSLLIAFILQRKSPFALPFGCLIGGLAMMVAMIFGRDPVNTPLKPVLRSPLLSFHVITIMIAYSLLAFMMLNSIAALILMRKGDKMQRELCELKRLSLLMLFPAVFLLTTGIFIGAIWANISWGRYWGWDPKEVWALITMLIYALPLHSSAGWLQRDKAYHIYIILAFLAVLMTYFGVNFFLPGLHSYA